jgi:hypothetical protein
MIDRAAWLKTPDTEAPKRCCCRCGTTKNLRSISSGKKTAVVCDKWPACPERGVPPMPRAKAKD